MESRSTESASDSSRQPAITDTTAEFEEYTAPPRLDEHGKPIARSKGLNAAGYQFPPPGGPQPPLTKANLAKGIGVPELSRAAPTAQATGWPVPPLSGSRDGAVPATLVRQLEQAPIARPTPAPSVKVDEGAMFEEYQRPDLGAQPRTGKGLRTEPPGPPTAKEILQDYVPPEPQVVTPKRFSIMPGVPSTAPKGEDEQSAELDAGSDVAAAPTGITMSSSASYGPIKTVIHHDDQERHETLSKSAVYLPPGSPGTPPTTHVLEESGLPSPLRAAPQAVARSQWAAPTQFTQPAQSVQAPQLLAQPTHASSSLSSPPAAAPHLPDLPALRADGPVPRIGIVQADFNTEITDAMAAAANAEALRLGAPVAAHIHVPGAYDIPLAAKRLLARSDIDAVVAIGCVIQGQTGHDELITHATAQTLLAIACNLDKPIGLGITGPRMTRAQAEARIHCGAFAVSSVVAQYRVLKTA